VWKPFRGLVTGDEVMERGDEIQHRLESPGKGYRPFLLVVLFGSLYLTYLILRPFMETLIFAIVLSSMFYPLQIFLVRRYRGRKTLAALTIVFIFTFLIALPVFFFVSALVSQGLDSINQVNDWLKAGNLHKLTENPKILAYKDWLQDRLEFIDLNNVDIPSNLLQLSKTVGQFLLSKGATILGNVATLVMHFAVMVFVIFYLVRDGKDMIERGRYYSPLRRDQEDRILGGVRVVARSVLLGSFLTALLQGLVGGIGLILVGIPGLFWGTVMGFSSLVPVVGTSLVWIPAVIYLLLLGKTYSALFLILWSILLIGSIDNFLRPFFMGGQAGLSPFYIFLAIIGGVQYYGLAGILYGPLILSFAMVMLYIYGAEYREDLLGADKGPPPPEMTGGIEDVSL
jgi:predicted PurR-regulated permease PerM